VSWEREIQVYRLGRVEYEDGLRLQQLFGEARERGVVPDVLLLLEHPPVITLGRGGKAGNIVAPQDALQRQGIEVFETNRGGDVTYHGPGQLVGYPIFQLEGKRQDVRRYVRDVEEAMIRACASFGVTAGRIPDWTGVWVGEKGQPGAAKIGAIGVHLSHWRTSHGFALNVSTDLSHFQLIVPCGIREAGVTSLERVLDRTVPMGDVEQKVAQAFGELFESRIVFREPTLPTVSLVMTRGPEVLLLHRTPERGGFWQPVTGLIEAGETPATAAQRELREETGAAADVADLDYTHAFAMGEAMPPEVARETAFAARWPGGEVRLDAQEHDAFEWVSPAQALERLPYAGLREAVRRATS
jgi:lipoyl(octanoyl) transferase